MKGDAIKQRRWSRVLVAVAIALAFGGAHGGAHAQVLNLDPDSGAVSDDDLTASSFTSATDVIVTSERDLNHYVYDNRAQGRGVRVSPAEIPWFVMIKHGPTGTTGCTQPTTAEGR